MSFLAGETRPEHVPGEHLAKWAQGLPKVALHRHLEGSLRLRTLAEIATEYHITLPVYELEALRPYVQITSDPPNFHNYIGKFALLRYFYVSKDIIQRVAREAIKDAARDNVRYLELRFNPVALSRIRGFALNDAVEWVLDAAEKAQAAHPCRVCLILQVPREEPLTIANEMVDIAIAHLGPQLRAIDLAGDEVHHPPQRFAEPFRRAKQAGVHIIAHAGEAMGAESVRNVLTYLDAERIGHGIRSIEDPAVLQMLREREVTLEVCPTSNFQTGAAPNPPAHPLYDLYNLGIRVTVNTDNPSISATSLSNEYVVSVRDIGLKPGAIYRMLRNAVDAAFIPDEERAWLWDTIHSGLAPYPGAQEVFSAPR